MTTPQTPQLPPLLPCPFCGRPTEFVSRACNESSTGKTYIASCFCGGYSACAHQQEDTLDELVSAWNRRAALEAQKAETGHMTPDQVRDGIADFIETNSPHREWWTPDVVALVRSIEIRHQAQKGERESTDSMGMPLSCGKPLCDLAQKAAAPELVGLVGLTDEQWYWVSYEGLGRTYHAPAMYKANVDCFYSYEFGGIPSRNVKAHYLISILPTGTASDGGEG
jgi:hypothetical protein